MGNCPRLGFWRGGIQVSRMVEGHLAAPATEQQVARFICVVLSLVRHCSDVHSILDTWRLK